MLRHGFHPPEAQQGGSIQIAQSVHPQGRTPESGNFCTLCYILGIPAARAGGHHAEHANAAWSSRANRVTAAVSYNAALTFCPDHSMGAGQPPVDKALMVFRPRGSSTRGLARRGRNIIETVAGHILGLVEKLQWAS